MEPQHLWEIETSWFLRPDSESINGTFSYKSWKDFQEYKPYKLWKPYILSSWSWKLMVPAELQPLKKHPRRDAEKTVLECRKSLTTTPLPKEPTLEEPTPPVDMLQIVFISPDRFSGLHRAEIRVSKDDEEEIRTWLKHHMPNFWKL
jgi:hypothetical protein